MEEEKSSTGKELRKKCCFSVSQPLLGRIKKMECSESMKSAHNDAVPLQQDRSLMALEFASCNTGENITKDACGLPVEPESELGTEHSAQGGIKTTVEKCSREDLKRGLKIGSWDFFSRPSVSQTSSLNDETLKSSTGKELREKGCFSLARPCYLKRPHTGQSLIDYSTPLISLLPESELDTEHFALGGTKTTVAVAQYSREDLKRGLKSRPSDFYSRLSPWSQISSLNNKSFPAASSSSDPLYKNIFETFPAFIETDRDSDTDIPDRSLCSLSETVMMNNCSSAAASTPRDPTDNTTEVQGSSTGTELREKELSWYPIYGTWNLKRQHTGQSLFNYSTPVGTNQSASSQVINPSDADLSTASQSQACTDLETLTHRYRDDYRSSSLQLPGEITYPPYRTATDECGSSSQSRAPPVAGPPCPQGRPTVIQNSTDCIAGSGAQEAFHLLSVESESDIAEDENDETYRFQCSCAGLYRCSVTGLLFHMAGEGDVVYRTVPWDWRLLARHHKKPAGPLFNIKCEQQSVRSLHLPHCEIRSTGGCDFLSVAHVKDEGVEFIDPQEITETHVLISITGFSAFGNVKDEDSPPVPVRAQVLLFYRPPADPDPQAFLNVLLLPRNVVLRDVLRTRKKLVGDEIYIEVPSNCKLTPEQEYTLCTLPEDDQVEVQPTEAEFDCEDYGNYCPSFQVTWETTLNRIMLLLRDAYSSNGVWEGRVYLSAAGARRCCGPSAPDIPSPERLLDIRSRFVEGISGPVLKSLLDKLLEKKVMTETERESADEMPNNRDKARFVIDTVRKKGEAASSEMIKFFCEADPFLCEHLGLI